MRTFTVSFHVPSRLKGIETKISAFTTGANATHRKQVAVRLGVDRMSVGAWLRAYETGGLVKLLDRLRGKRRC